MLKDVEDGYVTVRRAAIDLDEDPETVAECFRAGELDTMDLVRHYGVVLDWGSGELLSHTTEQYREMLRRRSAASWSS